MRSTNKWRLFVALLAALTILGAACGGGEEAADDTTDVGDDTTTEEFPAGSPMADIVEKGEIVIGVKYDVPPFGFKNPQTNEIEGFDVDLGSEIADALGVEPKFVEAISDNRIPFLKDGTVDLILSTMTITTDREYEIDFSKPYFIAHGRILVPKDSDIAGVEDLAGKRVCTAIGSTYEATLKEQAPEARLELVDAYSECFELIQNGAVDAVSTDDVILTGMIIQDDSLHMVGDELTTEPYGVGIPDGEDELQQFVDSTLDEVFSSGRWTEVYDNWVGQYTGTEGQTPPTMTLQEALDLRPCDEFCKQWKEKDEDVGY